MQFLPVALCLVFTASGCYGATFYTCGWITSPRVSCDQFPDEPTCGSDKVTYTNKCFFSRQHCVDTTLDLIHTGPCTDLDFVTTESPIAGAEAVFDFFCKNLSHNDCDLTENKVCGSNTRTYWNFCEYEKGRCTHGDLHVAHFGDCAA